ncbi:MAG: hypothetical protein A2808_03855 [Candidatus Moranbacteria bacterium RIFCSPHIGHO2_01_FULL_55_24]|nr:MAG: hypothetical protein A2808_03855 [Candidatus Moranbacteria bacterium RIFCSPHIGHO2_01_FULL_55_24]
MRKFVARIFLGILGLAALWSVPFHSVEAALKPGTMKDYRIVVPGVLSRSSVPSGKQLLGLKEKGWKSVITLVSSGELAAYKKIDPTLTEEFKRSGLKKFSVIIPESQPPTEAQALQFLAIVKNPKNQPVHIYCRKGHARTGTMIALYRYSVQKWTMKKAIREAERYGSGIGKKQRAWLTEWARTHPN